MSENVVAELETRLLRLEHEFEKLISDRIPSLEKKFDLMENKTNKLLTFFNYLEEKMMEIDREVMKLNLPDKR